MYFLVVLLDFLLGKGFIIVTLLGSVKSCNKARLRTLTCGRFVDNYDYMVVLGCVVMICGVGLWWVPYCSSIYAVAALISCLGLAMGVVDTVGNVAVLAMWKNNEKTRNSVLQAVHAGFALGGMLCSPLARPFLGEYKVGDESVSDIMKDKTQNEDLDQSWIVVSPHDLTALFRKGFRLKVLY